MQVSVEATSGLERRLTIGIPSDQIEVKINARLKDAAKNVKLDGFRPGKVPLSVVKRRYGMGVREEVLREEMQNSFYQAISQENLKPAGQPKIEPKAAEEGSKELTFVATFEVFPEISLTSLDGVNVTKLTAEVSDEDLDKMIDVLRNREAIWNDADGAAESGDRLKVDFEGTIEGEAFEGGSATDFDLSLGSNSMIPGFEDGLLGKAIGEEVSLDLTFPEEYHSKDLAGKAVNFKVTIKSRQVAELPELNDEFFAKYGVEDGGKDEFLNEVKSNMERELRQASKAKVKSQILDALIEKNDIDIPSALVASEIETIKSQAMRQFGQGQDPSKLPQLPDEMFSEEAKRRVKLGLLINEVISTNDLKADSDKVDTMLKDMASTYQEPDEVIKWYKSNPQQLQQIEAAVLEEQAIDRLLDQASLQEEASSYEEVIKSARG